MKISLAILFLLISFTINLFADSNNRFAEIVILDKSSSSKYQIKISEKTLFRSLTFNVLSCSNFQFEKYVDQISLISISNNNKSLFTGWFFSKTEELNSYSDKIYEISLLKCIN